MRTVFFGTPELAVAPLAAVASCHEVTALVCQPDRPKGRGKKLVAPPTKVWAEEHGIPVVQPTKLNDGTFEAWLRDQRPDVCTLAAYGRVLKQPILDVPTHGFLNVHPSLLPRHRGTSPIQTAILQGDEVTGVSIMRLDAGMDTGDVILQETLPIADDDTTATLSEKLSALGARMLVDAMRAVEDGTATFTPQDDALATHTRLLAKGDGDIHWDAPARTIHNLVRAAFPWPVARCVLGGESFRLHRTDVIDESADTAPGTVTAVGRDGVHVATGDGQLAILVIQAPGKRAMDIADFLNGHAIACGDRFESV
ncbi:MAG: methionyl-tRNA formyltransferase [Nitrospiraceae bacterium]|nr:methionyl-tRNA formyltransferase [Nitrospiraceae bacterium]